MCIQQKEKKTEKENKIYNSKDRATDEYTKPQQLGQKQKQKRQEAQDINERKKIRQ